LLLEETVRLRCLVDNSVQAGSAFRGEHGLSFLVETDDGQRLLFDTGATGSVLLHDLACAGVGVESIDAVVLSHSHPDHTGGLATLLQRRAGLTVHAHPEVLRPRYSERDGTKTPRGLPMSSEEVMRQADLRLHQSPERVLPGVWTSGEITERPEPEGRSPHHLVRRRGGWGPDPYADDLSLVLETSAGLFVVCGCCHAGLLNTLRHVSRHFGQDPVGVAGGSHLIVAGREQLARTVEGLRELHSPVLHLNHCTGPAAFVALSKAFEGRVFHCPAGTTLEL
jgi:7,8-dihydropterin-6-yl-methyl-4-(beta-D-ribofuranosyl)aminobenzene 5'-phosphate synthase